MNFMYYLKLFSLLLEFPVILYYKKKKNNNIINSKLKTIRSYFLKTKRNFSHTLFSLRRLSFITFYLQYVCLFHL